MTDRCTPFFSKHDMKRPGQLPSTEESVRVRSIPSVAGADQDHSRERLEMKRFVSGTLLALTMGIAVVGAPVAAQDATPIAPAPELCTLTAPTFEEALERLAKVGRWLLFALSLSNLEPRCPVAERAEEGGQVHQLLQAHAQDGR